MAPKEVDKVSATMEWKPPLDDGGLELKGYIIEYSEIYKEQWTRVEEVSTQTVYKITNLTQGPFPSLHSNFHHSFVLQNSIVST